MSYWIVGIALVATVASTGVQVYGQRQQAKAAENTADYNAAVDRNNAVQAQRVAAENIKRKQDEARRGIAAQRAALATSGLAIEGTPLAVLGETQKYYEMEANDIGFDAYQRARGLFASADAGIVAGQQTASGLRIQQYGTILNGVSSAATGYRSATGKI